MQDIHSSDNTPTAELRERIQRLRAEREAVILAHNYQRPEVQDIADFTGDSLELSRKAAALSARVVVFCGVHFMAETAAILSPDKTVLLPDPESGCPMADMITAEELRQMRQQHPQAAVVCYVNSSAAVKAESDVCCTSANAEQVVASLGDREILFVPDKYLGGWVARRLGRQFILWDGFCPSHVRILPSHIQQRRQEYPNAKVLVHPECRGEVAAMADEVLSTGGMLRYVRTSDAREFIIGTEIGILHRLRQENPEKRFVHATELALCPNMKKITLEKVARSLEYMEVRIAVPEAIRQRAETAVRRMLEVS